MYQQTRFHLSLDLHSGPSISFSPIPSLVYHSHYQTLTNTLHLTRRTLAWKPPFGNSDDHSLSRTLSGKCGIMNTFLVSAIHTIHYRIRYSPLVLPSQFLRLAL